MVRESRYSREHEWIKEEEEGVVLVGISTYAQEQLGEVVYVEMPEIGKVISRGTEVAVVESTKAASEIYSPLSGEVIETNIELGERPELVNESPEDEGWIYKLRISDKQEIGSLMSKEEYDKYTAGLE